MQTAEQWLTLNIDCPCSLDAWKLSCLVLQWNIIWLHINQSSITQNTLIYIYIHLCCKWILNHRQNLLRVRVSFTNVNYTSLTNCLATNIYILYFYFYTFMPRMDESADARRILATVPQSNLKRSTGRPYTSWLTKMKNDLSSHNLSVEDATELNRLL